MILTPSPKFKASNGLPYQVAPSGTHYHPDTRPAVAAALEGLLRDQRPVRIFYGDETGVAWPDENDVSGRIGRSMGPCKVPLIVGRRQSGGPALLDHCLVAILAKGRDWVWKHEGFDPGEWVAKAEIFSVDGRSYAAATFRNGALYGRHTSLAQAERLVSFMTGERLAA